MNAILSGQIFGNLRAIKNTGRRSSNYPIWEFECLSCGKIKTTQSRNLKKGKGCGCRGAENLKGKTFGELKVLEILPKGKVVCECSCGKIITINRGNLTSENTKSCGCIRTKQLIKRNTKHGQCGTLLYGKWVSMKERCSNPNADNYKHYGGRGISICNEWLNDFQSFYDWAITNSYKDGLSIERIDTNKNYCPDNCEWIELSMQQANKRDSIRLLLNKKLLSVNELSELIGANKQTIYSKIYNAKKRGENIIYESIIIL